MKDLQVTSVRYFETRRGIGYECQTNMSNVEIWNDGDGGPTFVAPSIEAKKLKLYNLPEEHLESLIDKYENSKQ
jgi:hypothetical protein